MSRRDKAIRKRGEKYRQFERERRGNLPHFQHMKSRGHYGIEMISRRCLDYACAQTPAERMAIATETESFRSARSMATSGAMFLDLAFRDSANAEIHLAHAAHNLSTAAAYNQNQIITGDEAKAAVYLGHLDAFRHKLLTRRNPPHQTMQMIYEKHVALSLGIGEAAKRAEAEERYDDAGDLVGILAESVVSLPLQRFGIREFPDGTWTALPALFGDDHNELNALGQNTGYDIAGFTQDHPTYEAFLAYKIQVKASGHFNEDTYASDITTVVANTDLSLPRDGRVFPISLAVVARECMLELEAEKASESTALDGAVTDRLNQRTDQLLELLG